MFQLKLNARCNFFHYYIVISCVIFCGTNANRLTTPNALAEILPEFTTTEKRHSHDTITASNVLAQTRDVALTESFLSPVEAESSDCSNHTCVRKCCLPGTVLSFVEPHIGCVPPLPGEPSVFQPVFYHKDGRTTESDKPVHLLTGFPHEFTKCLDAFVPKHRKTLLLSDGSLYTVHEKKKRTINEYCVDLLREVDSASPILSAATCYTQYPETVRASFRYYAHSICLVLSCCCLVLLLTTHIWEPRLRDLRGRCLMCYMGCLLISDVALLCATLFTTVPHGLCVTIGIILHVALISTFMWLTVMCFDIWRYVRLNLKGIPSALQGEEKQMFLKYSAAVWGTMSVIATVTCTLHFLPDDVLPDYIIRPHFGVNRCFIIADDANLLVYLMGFLGFLCAANLLLVFMTMMLLYKGGAKFCCFQRKLTDSDTIVFSYKHLDTFWNRFQIFVMTIVLWTTEVLSWKIPPKELWELTDLLNTLQGVILLVIFFRDKRKREVVLGLIRHFAGRVQQTARSATTASDEASSTLVSTFNEKLEGSDPETVDKIRKLSHQKDTAASTRFETLHL